MALNKFQKVAWVVIAIFNIVYGIFGIFFNNTSYLVVMGSSMQALGGVIIFLITYMVFKKKESD